MAIKAVIFDCDGVMFHSDHANVSFYEEVLRSAGAPPLPAGGEVAAHAMASVDLFKHYFGDDLELLTRVREAARKTSYDPFFDMMQPREHLYEVLAELREDHGQKIAMATNRSSTFDELLKRFGLGELFDFAVGARGELRPKPYPDMLLACTQEFGLKASEAIFVGDQASDAASAQAAAMPFVGIGPVAEDSEHSIESLRELAALLGRFG